MRRLDPAIERLFRDAGQELVFQSGSIPYMAQRHGTTPLLRVAISTPQIVQALQELLPPEMKASFPSEGTTEFVYPAPVGAVQVSVDV